MSWYSNPWVVGIIGSVPGGFLVNWVTGLILGKRENREYLQKVMGANREVVYAIRPGISEGQIPSPEVLTALLNATARRYGVEPSDLYTPSQIAEELTKEVMDSSFISSVKKDEYCKELAVLGAQVKNGELAERSESEARTSSAEYREKLVSSMSMLLGLMTVTMTAMFSLLELIKSKDHLPLFKFSGDKRVEWLVPMAAVITTMTLTALTLVFYRDFVRRRDKERELNNWLALRSARRIRTPKGPNVDD